MLIDQLSGQISDFKWIYKKEQLASNRKEQQRLDKIYSELVCKVNGIIKLLKYCNIAFQFNLTDELKSQLKEVLLSLSNCINDDYVDEESLNKSKSLEKNFEAGLKNAWLPFYKSITGSTIGTLKAIKSINKIEVDNCLSKIEKGANWGLDISTFKRLKEGLSEAEVLIDNLDLNEQIIEFLKRISLQRANITDLTPQIMEWIYKENLESKIHLRM